MYHNEDLQSGCKFVIYLAYFHMCAEHVYISVCKLVRIRRTMRNYCSSTETWLLILYAQNWGPFLIFELGVCEDYMTAFLKAMGSHVGSTICELQVGRPGARWKAKNLWKCKWVHFPKGFQRVFWGSPSQSLTGCTWNVRCFRDLHIQKIPNHKCFFSSPKSSVSSPAMAAVFILQ